MGDDVACTTNLEAGDLLLLRGDIIHRTQPHNSWRTSLKITMPSRSMHLTVSSLLKGGIMKHHYMASHPALYVLTAAYAATGLPKDNRTIRIIRAYIQEGASAAGRALNISWSGAARGVYTSFQALFAIHAGYWIQSVLYAIRSNVFGSPYEAFCLPS